MTSPAATSKAPTRRVRSFCLATTGMASVDTSRSAWGCCAMRMAVRWAWKCSPATRRTPARWWRKSRRLQTQYGLKKVIFVGDRGMVTQANVQALGTVEGLHLISALTHKQIVSLLERRVIKAELFDEQKVVEVIDPENPHRRYELCRNPESAKREGMTRRRLLDLTQEGLKKIAHSPRKSSDEKIGARVGRVLQQYKMGKFVVWDVQAGQTPMAIGRSQDRPRDAPGWLLRHQFGCAGRTDGPPASGGLLQVAEFSGRRLPEFEDRVVGDASGLPQEGSTVSAATCLCACSPTIFSGTCSSD